MNTTPTDCSISGLSPLARSEALTLAHQGYSLRNPLFDPVFADAFIEEIDRLIGLGLIRPVPDRMVAGQPTEWVTILGVVSGNHLNGPVFQASPWVRTLYEELRAFGSSYNAVLPAMLASGLVSEAEASPIAVEGMEMNLSRVIGSPTARWSGHHLHQDTRRFNLGMQALEVGSVPHDAIRARAFTVSGYARPLGSDNQRRNDWGGGLPFLVRESARNPGDKAVFDLVAADHNTGAFFFPHTTHGVGRMPARDSVRYSFQAFYPAAEAWNRIAWRLASADDAHQPNR